MPSVVTGIIGFSDFLLAPLLIAGVLVVARGARQRSIAVLSVIAFIFTSIGVVLYDRLSELRGLLAFYTAVSPHSADSNATRLTMTITLVLLAVGTAVWLAAVVLSLSDAAQSRRWTWFTALLLSQLIAQVLEGAFTTAAFQFLPNTPLTYDLYRGAPGVSPPFYLVVGALVALRPLATLLYSFSVHQQSEAA